MIKKDIKRTVSGNSLGKRGSLVIYNRECNANILLILMMLCFLVISLYMTTQTYLNWDVSWLLEASRRLLSGGSYSQNFMETNPPLILFLYAIPIYLTSWMGNLVSNFLIFIYIISFLSLGLSYFLLKRLMATDDSNLILFFGGLVFCELVLPSYEFGQREHLMLLLIMPYVLLISSVNTLQFPLYFRFAVGLMAGIGFSIKPHFLIPLILILSWQLCKNRSLLKGFTIENGCLLGVMLLYLVSCFIITPDYFNFILPIVFKFYLSYKESMFGLLTHEWSIVFYITMLLGIIQLNQKYVPYRNLYQLLMLTNFGFFLVFIIGGHFFYYHFIVVAAISILLLMFNIQLISQRIITKSIISIEYLNIPLVAVCLYLLLDIVVNCDLWILKRDAQGPTRPLIMAFQNINHGPFVVFSNYVAPYSSLLIYTQLHSSARLHQFWLLPGIAKLEHDGQLSLAEEGKNLLRQVVVQDLLLDPPYIIVVDETDPQIIIDGRALNYLHFFLQDLKFKKIWHNYHLEKRVTSAFGNYAIYTLRS